MIDMISEAELFYKDNGQRMALCKRKITNGSMFFIGGELSKVQLTLDQHFNWFQKLMWKLCFGVRVENYYEE